MKTPDQMTAEEFLKYADQPNLTVYGSGDMDDGTGQRVGCADIASLRLMPGYVLMHMNDLKVLAKKIVDEQIRETVNSTSIGELIESIDPGTLESVIDVFGITDSSSPIAKSLRTMADKQRAALSKLGLDREV